MTAQVSDRIEFNGDDFAIAEVDGIGIFEPEQYGLKTIGFNSACRRGCHCFYMVQEGELTLRHLHFDFLISMWNRSQRRVQKQIENGTFYLAGVQVQKGAAEKAYAPYHAQNLNLVIPFTGCLLVGTDFVSGLYVHLGFHPAYKYRTVYELQFDQGRLIQSSDVSAQMEQTRAEIAAKQAEQLSNPPKHKRRWWFG